MRANQQILDTVNAYMNQAGTLIVLKGIDINLVHPELVVDMDVLLENKLQYLFGVAGSRQVITYDEYLALYDFVVSQYQQIVIIENNLFINYFPLQVKLSEQRLTDLVTHFDEEKQGDRYEIGNIVDLTTIYGNISRVNDSYYIIYNHTLTHEKEKRVVLFESVRVTDFPIASVYEKSYDITDEEDYVELLDDLLNGRNKVFNVIEKETAFNKSLFREKFGIVIAMWDGVEINAVSLEKIRQSTPVRQEFYDILIQYWGRDSFRNIKVYDTRKLDSNEKVIQEVSQSDIITDIVEEAEKCKVREDYRDVFVTAPTGAGKSAMFQVPAIYLAEKHELFTIVISPLIGLMKDQVSNLELNQYSAARTINSDISPIKKQEIINDISDKKCHILYLSPESLLSKSDLEQIIGERTLGLLVVDEAHIVTTWGKQFRPDYWYLGDHLNKMKKSQIKSRGMGFVIATFTATAIYGGVENMYEETLESLKMVDPITYLGYVKRHDIWVNVKKTENVSGRTEYELNKFDQLIEKIDVALTLDKKMLIYFPTVALINRFFDYCHFKGFSKYVSRYHGQLSGYEKEESYHKFLNKENPIMLATKAFGMGIDIDDIEVVAHFSPTGNVCDYVQEIGRVARRPGLDGEAFYKFMSSDFKHINRLHGLSIIKEYQLVEVIRKVYELYQENIRSNQSRRFTKKRNEMLVDAESFSHIFENPFFNEDDGINKVKTAMLLIQKDFEKAFSFSPFTVRPIPLFEIGYFKLDPDIQQRIKQKFGYILHEVEPSQNICSVNLKSIWEHSFNRHLSFPKFKFMLYTKHTELQFEFKDRLSPALCITIDFQPGYLQKYETYLKAVKAIVNKSIREEKFYGIEGDDGMVNELCKMLSINVYKARSIVDTILSAMSVYQRDFCTNMHAKTYMAKPLKSGQVKYKFLNGTNGFFRWIEAKFNNIIENTQNGSLYLVSDIGGKGFKEYLLVLGILETLDLLVFKALGGSNSQIYIYVNQTKTMKEIIDKPWRYKNRLLAMVSERHNFSVEMLTFLFEGGFSNEQLWDYIEDYFLGIIPETVIKRHQIKIGKTDTSLS